ncbi:hypothetical protein [Citrobacter meridianamericanus]|uniref:Uncharacterized protein n=1 Tax=Citrobacter meridianamericanus TaxID=2894201 RepID=A0ABT1B4I7_9ENTR|nr:hypothetical protein [Citrobacter meridianamericanus]MCO5780790.1 hypothetical protein [Citrobacter meridianamericanus]
MSSKDKCTRFFIYSADWTHAAALQNLISGKKTPDNYISLPQLTISELCEYTGPPPHIIILDVPPGRYVALILALRKSFPQAQMICTQHYFLYSDRMVAEYFGGILLKEYDALISGYPNIGIAEHLTSPIFSAAYPRLRFFCSSVPPQVVLGSLEKWIRRRLSEVIPSSRTRTITLDWLARGISLRETAKQLKRSEKVMYHYRWMMMQALGIRHCSRDFIHSLTVNAGPTNWKKPDKKTAHK